MMRSKRVLATLVLLACGIGPRIAHAEGEATFGTQWWSQSAPEAKFQEFREVPQGAFLESFLARGGGKAWKTTFYGTNALRNDQQLGLALSRGVKWQLDGKWQQIPHNISQVARLGYTQVAPGVFILPDSLQARNQANPGGFNNTMLDYLNGAGRIPLGFRTDVGTARVRMRPSNGWQFEVKGERRDRSGNKPYGAAFGFNSAIELVEPIDQQTWNGEASANYARGRLSMRFSGGYSSFDNRVDALRWDNPKRLTDRTNASAYVAGDGSANGLLDLYPNNHALRGTAGLVLRLPRAATFSANVGASRLTQNDHWLPFTVNTAIPDSLLNTLYTSPARSTDAKAVRLNVDSRLAGRLVGSLHGALRYRQSHYDNQTPEHTFRGYVRIDQTFEPGVTVGDSLVTSHPFGNDQKTIGADLDYMLNDHVSFDAVLEHRIRTHTLREVEKDKEEYVRLQTGLVPAEDVHVELGVYQGIRVLDQFFAEDYQKGENPDSVFTELIGLRRYDVANRHQRGLTGALDVTLTERFDVGFDFAHERNRYPESVYGLRGEEINEGVAQATYKLSKRVDVSGGYGINHVSTDQESNESNANPPPTPDAASDWSARIHDRNDFAFGSVACRASDRLRLSADYTFSRDQADYDLHNGAGTAQNLPDTFYRRHDVGLNATYRIKGGTDLGLRYRFEEFQVVDFASQDIPLLGIAAGTATAMYLGDNALPYHAHVVSLVATRKF